MIIRTSELFSQGTVMLIQLLHDGGGFAGAMFHWLESFMRDRLEFAAHYPVSAFTGLLANAMIVWWLTHSRWALARDPGMKSAADLA